MRIVLDTNVILSALLWGGKPLELVEVSILKNLQIFSSQAIVDELSDVLSRAKLKTEVTRSGLTVAELVDSHVRLATLVHPKPTPRIAPDPKDDVILGTALAAEATYLITGDKPFLSVGSCQSVQLVTVTQFLDILATPSPIESSGP